MAALRKGTLLSIALRDLRGGLRHLRLLLFCLMLGVTVMCCIGSMISGLHAGIDRDAKSLLGGDIEIRQVYNPLPQRALNYITQNSEQMSRTVTMRAMASRSDNEDERTLIELKSIDYQYPLYGSLELSKLAPEYVEDSHYSAAVDSSLMDALHLKLGDRITIGEGSFIVWNIIANEPDRGVNSMSLGPRVMLTDTAMQTTGLLKPTSLLYYNYRVKLAPGTNLDSWKQGLALQFPDASWNLRDWHDSAPGLTRLIDKLALFFALTGITSLAVAGIGISNAASVYMWSKRDTIATLKCLGASDFHIRGIYLVQMLIAGAVAIGAGLITGVIGEYLLFYFLRDMLPIAGEQGIYARPLLLSALLGFLTLLTFGLLPIERLNDIRPGSLFRGSVDTLPVSTRIPRKLLLHYAVLGAAMAWLAVLFTQTTRIPLYFAGGLLASMLLLYLLGLGLRRFALRHAHSGRFSIVPSMALANLARPGAATNSMLVALGIGMTLLVALALVGSNLRSQLEEGLPEHAPAFFLIDVQPSDLDRLLRELNMISSIKRVTHLPMVRGRIVSLNKVPVSNLDIADSARWAIQGDRGLTWAEEPPQNAAIVAGKWWPKDYKGEPLVSFDAGLAAGMGLKLGDTITIAALDKEITATIASLRDIQWGSLEMNFSMIFSPGALEGLPATYLATISAPQGAEKEIQSVMSHNYPQVGVVRVREALGRISSMLSQISTAVLVTAGITIVSGILVMASAIHASLHKRTLDTVMLKVLGVSRRRILRIYLTEFVMVAATAALVAVIVGSLAGWGVMQLMIFSQFTLKPLLIAVTLVGSMLVAIGLGLAGTQAVLNIRPSSLLRNE